MKKCLLLLAALMLAYTSFAQDVQDEPVIRKGYIGIAFGTAFPVGDIKSSAVSGGAQLTLVNFGYLISDHVGVAAKWFGTSFTSKYDNDTGIGLGGMMFGPLFSAHDKTRKVEFDFIPMIGYGRGTLISDGTSSTSSSSVTFGVSGATRWNCGKRISLSLGIDYIHGVPDDVDLSSVGIVFGLNLRL